MTESPQKQDQDPRHDKNRGSRQVKLWLLVGSSTVVIIAIWAILLPTQLRSLQSVNGEDIRRWQVIKEESGATSFKEALGALRGRLKEFDEGFGEESADETVAPDTEEVIVSEASGHLPLVEQESTIESEFELLKARLKSNESE